MIKLHFLYKALMDIIYPNQCSACNKVISHNNFPICFGCIASIPKSNFSCFIENPIKQKLYDIPNLKYCLSIYKYQKNNLTQLLIHKLKYQSNIKIGKFFGAQIAKTLIDNNIKIDFLVPVPMYKTKEKTRGYNQTNIIAFELAKIINTPVLDMLQKIDNTESQTKKSIYQRWHNQEEKFRISKPIKLSGKHLLIIDDVITTRATMHNCLKVFHNKNITLSVVCVAYS